MQRMQAFGIAARCMSCFCAELFIYAYTCHKCRTAVESADADFIAVFHNTRDDCPKIVVYIYEGLHTEKGDGMDDQRIVELYWARCERAISETADKYGGYCYSIAHHILQDEQDSEECVNDTYMNAWNAMPPHRPQMLSAFLAKITRNLSINRYKHNCAKKRCDGQMALALEELKDSIPSGHNVEQETEDRFVLEVLNRFLESLPEEKRIVFMLRYWYVRSVPEIARACEMSESKVKMMLHRTRKELKSCFEKEGILL